ncbi:speckle-type POZ [Brachionus plicatilis]|uniref:Speckle-type POZ n=1 Tax=Brachionus plicatilis TaxID=10195 RepID=A0A3M7R125_BRAPC|nr:speckle-type POZ [Brachionus plicatilis]
MYHLIDYVWCVEKFSQYIDKVGGIGGVHPPEHVYPLLTSPVFAYKNTRWVLNLYPEGLGDQSSQGYISLFIKYVSEDPDSLNAKVELSLLNNKNERVYCRDTGDHQYQTFIDFGYKQFLKIQDIREQKDELLCNGMLKIFTRVEFESSSMPSSLTWAHYDLLLFKENFKDLYESKNLYDIVIKVYKKRPVCADLQMQLVSLPRLKRLKTEEASVQLRWTCGCCDSFLADYDESVEIKAHKFVLASRSGKFRDLLKTQLVRSVASTAAASSSANAGPSSAAASPCNCSNCADAHPCTDFLFVETDRSPKVIEYLIRYMYTGYLDSLDSFAKDIYEISKEYKVHGLTNLARDHLINELNVHNCCDYLIFCVVNNDYEFNVKVHGFIQDNYEKIIKTNSYKQARRKYRELFENTFGEISRKIPNFAASGPFSVGSSAPSVSSSSSSSSSSFAALSGSAQK